MPDNRASTPAPARVSASLGHASLAYALLAAAYLSALPLDFISIDSAELSQVAREALARGDFFHFTYFGRPYLDKPPLVFWLIALSKAVLGDSRVAYRLPSALALIGAAFATRALGRAWRLAPAAPIVTIFFTTALSLQMLFDVRTDTLLVGCVALALWATWRYVQAPTFAGALVLGACVGFGILAKGPIAAVICAIAALTELSVRARSRRVEAPWRPLVRPWWLMSLIAAAIVIAPFCYGQYEQYGWRGVRFFLWSSSFGRITGESAWNNRAEVGPFFFVHTSAWQYLPWTPLVIVGLVRAWRRWRSRAMRPMDGFVAGGFVFGLVAIELSRYKLPHYFYPVYPLGVLLAGDGFVAIAERMNEARFTRGARRLAAGLVVTALVFALVVSWLFPAGLLRQVLTVACAFIALGVSLRLTAIEHRVALAMAIVGLAINVELLPSLLGYQSGTVAARIIDGSAAKCVIFRASDPFLPDALARPVPRVDDLDEARRAAANPLWIFTSPEGRDALSAAGFVAERQWSLPELTGSILRPSLLLPEARRQRAGVNYLLYGTFE